MAAVKKGASYDEVMQAVREGDKSAIEVAQDVAVDGASDALPILPRRRRNAPRRF